VCVSACLLIKPAVSQLVKEYSAFRGTRRFTTVFATAGHLPPSCARCNQAVVSHFRRVRKIAKSDYESRHVCPSARPHAQLGSRWMDFHEIWYLRIFRKYVQKIQVLFESDENDRHCT
jgi:hypothetical protein